MTAFKIMRSRHYKHGAKIDTRKINYGGRMLSHKPTIKFINDVIDLSEQHGAGFGEMLVMCVGFQTRRMAGVSAPSSLPSDKARDIAAASRDAHSILDGKFSATFWETLYERVRQAERPGCPSRLDSYFVFKDMQDLQRYRDTHWKDRMGDKMVCKVEIKACPVRFEADMVILDRVTEDMNFSAARPHILRYWDQEESDSPIKELLLQGKVGLSDRIALR